MAIGGRSSIHRARACAALKSDRVGVNGGIGARRRFGARCYTDALVRTGVVVHAEAPVPAALCTRVGSGIPGVP